jgi:hypothetical protein
VILVVSRAVLWLEQLWFVVGGCFATAWLVWCVETEKTLFHMGVSHFKICQTPLKPAFFSRSHTYSALTSRRNLQRSVIVLRRLPSWNLAACGGPPGPPMHKFWGFLRFSRLGQNTLKHPKTASPPPDFTRERALNYRDDHRQGSVRLLECSRNSQRFPPAPKCINFGIFPICPKTQKSLFLSGFHQGARCGGPDFCSRLILNTPQNL